MRWKVWLSLCIFCAGGCRPAEDAPPATPSASPSTSNEVRLASASGRVEVEDRPGVWTPVLPGDAVSVDAVLRTGSSGNAVLSLGNAATVRIAPGTQLSVADLEATISRITLSGGRITAVVGTDATLSIESGGVTALAGAGEVSALADGRGTLSVAARTSRVRLTAAGSSVDLRPGQQAVASARAGPSSPGAIPPSLFLKLGAPRRVVQRERKATVTGETTPGALVSVNGVTVGVTVDGRFTAPVPLAEGENRIEVTVTDASGRREEQELPPITVDSRVRETKAGVRWE